MRCPHVQGLDGVADGNVAVHAHDGEGEGACEHVVVVNGDHSLAEGVAKRPEAHEDVGALQRSDTDKSGLVS